jgi:hypothetical protein
MKALPNTRVKTIANIIYNEIIMIYGPPKELLSDNGRNLTKRVIKVYIIFLATKYRVTTSYYLRTNKIVENFNNLLGNILIKIFVN